MTPVDAMMAGVAWNECPPPEGIPEGMLYATHTGELNIGEFVLKVAMLNNGQRLILEESMMEFFGEGEAAP